MAASNTRFTQNSLGQSKTPIDSDHGIYRYSGDASSSRCLAARRRVRSWRVRSRQASFGRLAYSLQARLHLTAHGSLNLYIVCTNLAGSKGAI